MGGTRGFEFSHQDRIILTTSQWKTEPALFFSLLYLTLATFFHAHQYKGEAFSRRSSALVKKHIGPGFSHEGQGKGRYSIVAQLVG